MPPFLLPSQGSNDQPKSTYIYLQSGCTDWYWWTWSSRIPCHMWWCMMLAWCSFEVCSFRSLVHLAIWAGPSIVRWQTRQLQGDAKQCHAFFFDMSSSESSSSTTKETSIKRLTRSRVACKSCRRKRIRCIGHDGDGKSTCIPCNNDPFLRTCEWQLKQNGHPVTIVLTKEGFGSMVSAKNCLSKTGNLLDDQVTNKWNGCQKQLVRYILLDF